jgi:hypothetical protein
MRKPPLSTVPKPYPLKPYTLNSTPYTLHPTPFCAHRSDRASGTGICHYANGDRYEGGWKDDRAHGTGSYRYASGKGLGFRA